MKKQVAVIGLGRFGASLVATLHEAGHEVLAIDKDEKRVQEIASTATHAVQADATSESVLAELGLKNFQVAVVAMGADIESSVLCTILLRKLGLPTLSRGQITTCMAGSLSGSAPTGLCIRSTRWAATWRIA